MLCSGLVPEPCGVAKLTQGSGTRPKHQVFQSIAIAR
jgi:hypothetical protein